eukprot:2043826-Ditylum_brightwellii.AAC.1
MKQRFARANEWQAKLSKSDMFMNSAEWKGQMLYPLMRFIGQHSGAYIFMREVAKHMSFQLPNKFTRVGFLLDAIKYSDAGFHIPTTICPVLKKFQSGTKCDAIKILYSTSSGFGTKPSIDTSGVSLRYHTTEEYRLLSQPHKDKLCEWCNKSKWGQ